VNLKHKSYVINLYNFQKLVFKVKNIWFSISLIRHVKTNETNTYQHVAIAKLDANGPKKNKVLVMLQFHESEGLICKDTTNP